jgi:hypothetical protein
LKLPQSAHGGSIQGAVFPNGSGVEGAAPVVMTRKLKTNAEEEERMSSGTNAGT